MSDISRLQDTAAEEYNPGPSIDDVLAQLEPTATEKPAAKPSKAAKQEPKPDEADEVEVEETDEDDDEDEPAGEEADAEPDDAEEGETEKPKPTTDAAPTKEPEKTPTRSRAEEAARKRLAAQAREQDARERRYRAEIAPKIEELDKLRATVVEDPGKAIHGFLKTALDLSDAEAEQQLDDYFEFRTRQKLGLVEASESTSGSTIPGSLAREALHQRAQRRADEARRKAEEAAHVERLQREEAVASLSDRIMHDAQNFPWLAKQDAPGELVLGFAIQEQERTGQEPTYEAIAAALDQHFKDIDTRWYEQRKDLFAPQAAEPAAEKSGKSAERTTATPRKKKRSRSLTHDAASSPAAARKDEKPPDDPDAAMDWVLNKHLK